MILSEYQECLRSKIEAVEPEGPARNLLIWALEKSKEITEEKPTAPAGLIEELKEWFETWGIEVEFCLQCAKEFKEILSRHEPEDLPDREAK